MMPATNKSVLITGFGPFPGTPVNVSAELAQRLVKAACSTFPDTKIINATLPTEWCAAPAMLADLVSGHVPDIMLHFGVSNHAEGFQIETQARNICASETDACGAQPRAPCIDETGPAVRLVNLPFSAILARLQAMNVPATLSHDAGDYLCNAVLYNALASCSSHRCAGFIHIPTNLGDCDSTINWDLAIAGGLEIIAACIDAGAKN